MTSVEIDQRVRAIVSAYFQVLPSEVRLEARLETDLLGRSGIIGDIEEEFGITISTEEEKGIKTVQDLIACVNSKMSVETSGK